MTTSYRIEALSPAHGRTGFSSGSQPLDCYLAELAGQDVKRRISNCFVLVDDAGTVVGYYTLAATSVPLNDLPTEITTQLPRHALLPAGLIGRLAVDRRHQGKRLGGALVLDAVTRSSRSAPAIFALLVDAKDAHAAAFYRHLGFAAFTGRPLTLYLPVATALKALGTGR